MISHLTFLVLLVFVNPCLCSFINICSKNKDSIREPLLAALLDLHSGQDCTHPNVASFQQLAVLESTIKQINDGNKIKIGFQVFDTCSSEQGAVTAAMQAFVASQQTCLHSPLFTGFIGPENLNYLKAVKNFTKSFNFTHILSYSISDHLLSSNNVLHVSKYPILSYAQAIESMVERLGLKSPLIIADNQPRSRAIASSLRTVKPGTGVCITRVAFTTSSSSELEEIFSFSSSHDGVIVIIESEHMLRSVNRILDSESIQDPVIIADLQNSAIQSDFTWNDNILFLNQISSPDSGKNISSISMSLSNSIHSFVTDSNRICGKHKLTTCTNKLLTSIVEEEYSWSLQLYRMAIILLGSAVESAQKSRCASKPCLSPDVIAQNEWYDILHSASAILGSWGNDEHPITFSMNLPASYIIKTSFGSDGLKKIGHINNGDKISAIPSDYLPMKGKNVSCPVMKESVESKSTESSAGKDFFTGWLNPENAKLFEAVGLVVGAVVGILMLMLIATTCVYRNFQPDSSGRRSPSSHTTMSRAGSMSS